MDKGTKVCRITGILPRALTDSLIEDLNSIGIMNINSAVARALTLLDKTAFFGLYSGSVVVEDPIDVMMFLIPLEMEDSVLEYVVEKAEMHLPGRGTVYSEEVNLYKAHELCRGNEVTGIEKKGSKLQSELTGICCIVQRGEGDTVARVALDTGTCVPAITFGHGTGLRDKLGILRIAIPAEKEVINVASTSYDADAVMGLMVNAGKLNQPGKGFIYFYPIGKGLINTKITRGMPKHAASIEQIIATLDDIKGNVEWRRRSGGGEHDTWEKKSVLKDLLDLTFICDEGRGEDLVKVAMGVGAAGATISKVNNRAPKDSEIGKISRAREWCNMIVSEAQVDTIVDAIEKDGGFGDNAHGQVLIRPAPKACTYLGK
ncbi:MAG: hypothetical protein ABIH66_11645 [bacterium]